MDKVEALAKLKEYLSEIDYLRKLRHDNNESQLWANKVNVILEATFGKESDEYIKFNTRSPVTFLGGTDLDYQRDYLNDLAYYELSIKKILQKYEILGIEEERDKEGKVEKVTNGEEKKDSEPNNLNILDEFDEFSRELGTYQYLQLKRLRGERLKIHESRLIVDLRSKLLTRVGKSKTLIGELTEKKQEIVLTRKNGKEYAYDAWLTALKIDFNPSSSEAINYCADLLIIARGKLEDDIKKGKRDEQGNSINIEKKPTISREAPKAFIAHEGETRALSMLKEFLEALGIQYFIAESKASNGRSIEKQVDWTQSKADFAICLATKGKAINKKTGKHFMAPNIADELGRARQVFGNKIILLQQRGMEPHTNIREIVYETFTTTNMEKAFIKIAKELSNWGFITAGIKKETLS